MSIKKHMVSSPKTFNVAFFADGSFLPIRNGTYASIYGLMRSFHQSVVHPTLILCDRGWDDPMSYVNQKFRTLFIKPNDYYDATKNLTYAFSRFNIKYAHFYNAEDVVNIGRNLMKSGIKIVYEAINIDHVLYDNLLPYAEVYKMKDIQKKALLFADHVMCRSEVDRKHIMDFGIGEKKITVYNGSIYCKDIVFSQRTWKNHSVVFLGHMFYPPNEHALEVIKNDILPRLRKIDSSYSVTVIGTISNQMIEKYAAKNLIFKKGVDDLSSELLQHDIAVAPLYHGSGTRVKILDYLASGLSVITTKKGIEGLHPDIVEHVSVVEDQDKYASKICEIAQKQQSGGVNSYPGRLFVENYYDWSTASESFVNVYKFLS